MKAIVLTRYGRPNEAFEIQERPTPEPAAGQVRIAVEAFGLNYADVSARQGTYMDAPPIPCVLGYEVVGRIDALGAGVRGNAKQEDEPDDPAAHGHMKVQVRTIVPW